MGRRIAAAVVGGLLVFFWGALAHIVLPLGQVGFQPLPNETAVAGSLKANLPDEGMYYFPFLAHDDATPERQAEQMESMKRGPVGILVIHPQGYDAEKKFPLQLVMQLLACIAGAVLVMLVITDWSGSVIKRAVQVALLAVFAFSATSVSQWIWYGYPMSYTLAQGLELLVGWLLAGLGMAMILRPKANATA